MKPPVRVAVTGAAGQIGYSLIFRIAAGEMLGSDQPVILQLLEIPPAMPALEGVVMELDDCAFPLLAGIETSDQAGVAFQNASWALLVGSRPQTKGMERKELLEANGAIFTEQGRALAENAADDIRILVVGNPANTNCLIAMNNAKEIDKNRFTAMTRLDHNRAKAQLVKKLGCDITDIKKMTVWGNHSATQYPDLFNCEVGGKSARDLVGADDAERDRFIKEEFLPTVQQRGAEIISARGASSAASAANAAIDHIRDWNSKTPKGDWVSMSVVSDGSYGVPEGLISSFPCTTDSGEYKIVEGLDISDLSRELIDISVAELGQERDTVNELSLI